MSSSATSPWTRPLIGCFYAVLAVILTAATPATSQEVGAASKVVNKVLGKSLGYEIRTDQKINFREEINTLAKSGSTVSFKDGTALSIGEDSQMTIDEFVYDPASGSAKGAMRVVKGVLRGDDAVQAIEHGAAGVVVSNHGGRQLDGAIATATALPEVVQSVAGRVPVIVDGGIRRGTDMLRALALGATAVQVGRPVLWGLATAGAPGVERVLRLLMQEFSLAMALAGCPDVRSIRPDLLARG